MPGQTATFNIVVRNDGFFSAPGATVVARLNNADATFVSSSSAATWNPPSAGLTFTRRNSMPVGTETITVTVLLNRDAHYFALGAINFSATAHSGFPDPSGAGQTNATTDLAVRASSNLTIEKTLITPTVGTSGRALYDVSICNSGPSSIDGIGIIDTPGLNMTPGSAIFNSDANSLYIPALGCERTTVSAEVAFNASNGASFTNTAQVNTASAIPGSAALGALALAPTVNAPSDTETSGTVFIASNEVNLRLVGVTLETVNAAAVPPTGPIIPGLTAQFRIAVRNVGSTPANGVTVTGQLRGVPGVQVASQVLGQPWTQGSSGLTFARGQSLAAGATDNLLVTLFIPSDAHYTATGPVSFVAGVIAAEPDSNFGNNTATSGIINLKAISDLTIDKQLLTKKVSPNGTALYNIELCNRGFSDIKGLGINDVIGANLAPLSLVIPQTADTDSLYVPAAQCIDLPVSARVTSGAIAGSVFDNTATIDISNVIKGSLLLLGNVENPVVNAATDADATGEVAPILPNADVQIDTVRLLEVNGAAVGVGGPIVPGQTAKFEIKIRNVGPDQALGATLVNRFSNIDAKVVATSGPSDWSPAGDGFTFTRLNPMPAGATETITLTMLVPADAHYTTVGNLDFVSSLSAVNPETNIFNNTASTGPLSVQLKAGLTLDTTLLSGTVAPGGLVLAEAEICNPGPSDIQLIKFTATAGTNIQPGSVKVSFTPNANDSYVEANRCVDALVSAVVTPSAVVGDPFSIVIANDNAMLVNGAAVLGALALPPSPLPNLSSTVTGTVGNYLPNADVQVVSTKLTKVNNVAVPLTGPLVSGQRAEFEVVVKNNGPSPAQGVVLVNQLRALGALVVASTSVGSPWSPVGTGLSFTRRDPMAAGLTETLTFTVDIPSDAHYLATRRIQLSSFVTADNPDQVNPNNRLDTGDINIKAIATLAIEKTLLTPEVAPGGTAQYEITVCNSGSSDVDGIEVKDIPDANLVAGSLVLSSDAKDLYVAAGDCVDVAASVQVSDSAVVGASFINKAEVEAAAVINGSANLGATALAAMVNEPSDTNNSGLVSQYLPDADVEITSVSLTEVAGIAGAGPIVPGETAKFDIVIKNNGAAPAEAVTVLSRLSNLDATVVSASSSGSAWSAGGAGLSFARQLPLAAGVSETLSIVINVPADAHYTAAGLIDFTAFISASNPDSNLANNTKVNNTFGVQAIADLSITKTLLTTNVAPDGTALFEITVCNSGSSDISGVKAIDTPGLNLVAGSLVISPDSADLYIKAGQCVDISASARVIDSAAPGDNFKNSAALNVSMVDTGLGSTLAPIITTSPASEVTGLVSNYLPVADVQVLAKRIVSGTMVPGATATFEIDVINNGPAYAEGVIVTDNFSNVDFTFVSSTVPPAWNGSGSSGTFTRQSPMKPGVKETLSLTLLIASDAHLTATGVMSNTAYVVASNPDSNPNNNSATTGTIATQGQSTLSLTKTLIGDFVLSDTPATFEIEVCNAGPSDVQGLKITDTPGLNLDAKTLILSPGAMALNVPATECRSVTASVQVNYGVASGSKFVNQAAVDTSMVVQGAGATLAPVVNNPTAMAMGLVGPELFSISGRVEDSTGAGIPDVTVSTGTGLSGITDSSGNFIITGVKSGSYDLDAVAANGTALGGVTVSVADANLTGVVIVAIQPLSGQVNFVWNGFLQQANILVLINKGDRMVDADIKIFDLDGNQTDTVKTELSPNSERDVIINDLAGFSGSSYGYLEVDFNNPKDFDGHMAFYRLSQVDTRDVEFSIIKPFDEIQKGTSFGTFNTMQPSLNPNEKSNLVHQWIQIINLSTAVQQYTLTFYNQIGKEIRKEVVAVPAKARRDIEGGHINPGPGVVGTIKVEPNDANAEYLAQIFRYGADAPTGVVPSSFSFAMGLATQKGGSGVQFAPVSVAKDSFNFVVVTNVSGAASNVNSAGTSADGSSTFSQTLSLEPFGQAHLDANNIIAQNEESGLLRLNSAASNLIIESTQYFYDPANGSVSTAFNTSGRSIVPGRNSGIYNNFLNAENMLKLHNTTNNPVSAILELYDLAGNSVGQGVISLAPRGVAEIELTLGFRLPKNTYGLVSVDSSVPGAIFSEILRTKQSLVKPSVTDLAASIPVR